MKRVLYLLSVFFFAIMIFLPSVLKAADVSVGASVWYATWDFSPVSSNNNSGGGGGGPSKSTMGPELMLGPSLSVRLAQDWTLATVFLYSATKYNMPDTGKITRMDSDTTLNYSITRYFKIFPGLKFMRFNIPNGYHQSVGPGLGAGVTIPAFFDNLFVIVNGSGAYLFGDEKNSGIPNLGFREYGFNASAGLAYYFESISTTVNLGYRYQYFYTKYNSNIYNSSDLEHTFSGFTMSVIYSF